MKKDILTRGKTKIIVLQLDKGVFVINAEIKTKFLWFDEKKCSE